MMKKILALILLTLLVLTACVPPEDNTTPFDEIIENTDPQNPVKGYSFLVKSEATDALTLVPVGDTVQEDAIRARYKDVAAQLGCTVRYEKIQPATTLEYFRVQKASGAKYADLLECDTKTVYNLYKGGYLAPLDNFVSDVSAEKWGYAGQKSAVADSAYSFKPLYWGVTAPTVSNVLFYNQDLLLAAETKLPAEYMEQGNWNWENFEKLCAAVTQEMNDEQSVYAFANPTVDYPAIIWAAIYSNGGRLAEDGVCALTKPETVDALTWLKSMANERRFAYTLTGNPQFTDLDVRAFSDRKTAFLVADADVAFSTDAFYPATVLEEDLRWATFPKGPKGNSQNSWLTERDVLCAMTKDANPEAAGPILEALFEPLNSDWQRYLNSTYFFHNEDFDLYLDLLQTALPDGTVRTNEINKALDESMAYVIAGDKSAIQAMEEIEDVVTALVAE